MADRIAVVDQQDRFLRWEKRQAIHEQRLVHRSVNVVVFGTDGRLLLQRRHPSKQTYADTWDLSCSGHVDESDYPGGPDEQLETVYRATAERELLEELGIQTPLEFLAHFRPDPKVHYEQMHLFRTISDGPFSPQPSEVTEVRFVNQAELRKIVKNEPESVTLSLVFVVTWLEAKGLWLNDHSYSG